MHNSIEKIVSILYHVTDTVVIGGVFTRKLKFFVMFVIMRNEQEVYPMSCIGVLPFIEGSLGDCTSGLVAVSHDSEEHA